MALTTSLIKLSCETGRTTVSVPSAASVQVRKQGGRFTLKSAKNMSTEAERETASAIASMNPPKLVVICTVRTTTRNGWASSGTGSNCKLVFKGASLIRQSKNSGLWEPNTVG